MNNGCVILVNNNVKKKKNDDFDLVHIDYVMF